MSKRPVNICSGQFGDLSLEELCRTMKAIGYDGFELAGEDGIFFPAEEVEILGNQIHIRSKQVKHPRNVRFKWTNYAEVRLFGSNGIPVAPFRTDEFPPEKTD